MPKSNQSRRARAAAEVIVASEPTDPSALTRFVLIQRPIYSEVLARMEELIDEFATPAARRETVTQALASKDGQQTLEVKYEELIAALPAKLKEQAVRTFEAPFEKAAAHALRDYFEKLSDVDRELWGAIVSLAHRLGKITKNGNHLKSYSRPGWLDNGRSAHPVSLQIKCPNCANLQNVTIALPEEHWAYVQEFRTHCSQCGLREQSVDPLDMSAGGEAHGIEYYRQHFSANPALRSNLANMQAHCANFLKLLSITLGHFEAQIVLDLQESAMKLDVDWGKTATYDHALPWNVVTQMYEAALMQSPNPTHAENRHRLLSSTDELLKRIPKEKMSLAAFDPPHIAAHWRDTFDAARARVERDIAASDAVEAAAQFAELIETCVSHGFLLPRLLSVELPEGSRLVAPVPRATIDKTRLRDVSIEELASFLSKSFSNALVTLSPEAIAKQLKKFQANRS